MKTAREAAQHFGISESRLQAICRKLEIPRTAGYQLSEASIARIAKFRRENPPGRPVGWRKKAAKS